MRYRIHHLISILKYLLMTAIAIVTLFPFSWMFLTSLKTNEEVMAHPTQLFSSNPTFNSYISIWTEVPFARFFVNSIIFAGSVVILALMFNSMAGYAFARLRFRGKHVLFIITLCTMMIPFQVIMVPLFLLVSKMGIMGTYAGLILPRAADAFGIFMMRQFFLTLPRDLEESGRIDGLTEFGIFRRIMLPLCKAPFFTLGLFIFMGNWNDLLYPMLFTNSEDMRPIQAAIAVFSGKYSTDYKFMMTGLFIASIPTILAYLFTQKYFIKSIAITGLKA